MRLCTPGLFVRLFIGVVVLATVAAQAADPPKAASFGKGKVQGPLLTRSQLRECLVQQTRVREHADETLKLQAALDADKAEIARLGTILKDMLDTLDRTSADAVRAYNAEALARDALIDAYNARTPEFNAKVDALQAEREAFAKGCENRSYDENDEFAIKAGK